MHFRSSSIYFQINFKHQLAQNKLIEFQFLQIESNGNRRHIFGDLRMQNTVVLFSEIARFLQFLEALPPSFLFMLFRN